MEIKKYQGKIIGIIGEVKLDFEIIKDDLEKIDFTDTIYHRMIYEIYRRNLIIKDYNKKIKDSLKIVDLKVELDRSINTLSESEKKQLQLAINLLENPNVIALEEPFKKLDLIQEKKMMRLFNKLKDEYNKTIIFISNNTNMLYENTDEVLIYKNNKLVKEGSTKEILENVEYLEKNKINIPDIVEFTHLAKSKYNVKIDYHRDIRDIIKDIYKHV